MSKSLTTKPDTAFLDATLARARKGDKVAVTALKGAFKPDDDLWRRYGDLGRQVERASIERICGDDLVATEGMTLKLATFKTDLGGLTPTPLERLLVDRIAACWLAVSHAEWTEVQAKPSTFAGGDYHQRRLDRAQYRYLSAIRALAVVRRLDVPTIQVNVAQRQVNIAKGTDHGEEPTTLPISIVS